MTSPQLNSLNNNGEMPTPKADTLADFRCFVTQTDPESRRSAWRENASDTSWSDRFVDGEGALQPEDEQAQPLQPARIASCGIT
ncbi:hypothetical protein ACVD2R_11840 [Escherichia coli]|nr:hypothetical protein [Escherichia coli]HEC5165783.1 hypothetical protein [Escherichia coli]HEC5174636.1 hypothetical protein [Escherichia coli]